MRNKLISMQRNDSMRSVLNIISFSVLHGISFLSMPLISRLLTTDQYGVTATYASWVALISSFVGMQAGSSLNNASVEFSDVEQPAFRSSALALGVSFFLVLLVAAVFLQTPLSLLFNITPSFVIFLMAHAFFTFVISFFSSYCVVTIKPLKYMLVSASIALLGIALSIVFILMAQGRERIYARIIGDAAPVILLGLCILVWFFVRGKTFYHKEYWKFTFLLCGPIVFHALASIILSQIDRVMLSRMIGDSAAGVYSATYSASAPVNTLWNALNSAWVVRYYQHMKENDGPTIRERANLYLFSYTCLCCGYLLMSPEIMRLLTPSPYWQGISVLPVLIAGQYFVFMYSFPANHEFFHRKTGYLAVATVSAALINIGLNTLLIPAFGVMGSAVATLVSNMLLFVIHTLVAFFAVRNYNYYSLWFHLKGCLFVFVCMTIALFTLDFLWLRWGIGLLIGIVLLRNIIKKRAIM